MCRVCTSLVADHSRRVHLSPFVLGFFAVLVAMFGVSLRSLSAILTMSVSVYWSSECVSYLICQVTQSDFSTELQIECPPSLFADHLNHV